jgi:PKHD-type hydroxylase
LATLLSAATENGEKEMLIRIPDVLSADEVRDARAALDAAEWVDGRVTAGYQAQSVKENLQLPEGHPVAVKLGEMVLAALARSPLFMSSALPLRVFPPMFNRYTGGGHFGTHVDTAIRATASTGQRIRTDVSPINMTEASCSLRTRTAFTT